jgi:hypothetical protein
MIHPPNCLGQEDTPIEQKLYRGKFRHTDGDADRNTRKYPPSQLQTHGKQCFQGIDLGLALSAASIWQIASISLLEVQRAWLHYPPNVGASPQSQSNCR